jgi:hypothetical protein
MPQSPKFEIEKPLFLENDTDKDWCPADVWARLLRFKWALKLVWAIFLLAIFILAASLNAQDILAQILEMNFGQSIMIMGMEPSLSMVLLV